MTPQQKLIRTNNNMDAIRYLMAFSVIVAHFNIICGYNIYWPITSATGVGGFFALSGFLIYGSYERSRSLKKFLTARALRILPPYFLIVLLCAGLLVFVSSLPPQQYFGSSQWFGYLGANLSFLNFLEPQLPGVFSGPEFNVSAVNGSLWTMKVEWCLYLSVPVVAWVVDRWKAKNAPTRVFLIIIIFSIAYTLIFTWLYVRTGRELYNILGRQFFGQLSFFYIGALAARYLPLLLRRKWLLLACLAVGWGLMQIDGYVQVALWPVVDGGLVIWFSMIGSWGKNFARHDNVSYDMYLFHFPILQTAVFMGIPQWGEAASFMTCLVAVVLLSLMSWNIAGRPAQRLRQRLVR